MQSFFAKSGFDARSRAWVLGACLICFAIGVAVIARPVLALAGFPLDDSWIHQVIGRNLAWFGVPSYAPGVATSGSSSTIWPWIIAINYRLLGWVNPVTYLLLLNAFFLLVVLLVLFASAVADKLSPLETVLIAALPALSGNFVWLIATGMEHLLLIASVFAAAYFWFLQPAEPSRRPALLAGIFCGLAILSRPEAVVFAPVFLIVGWPLRKPRADLIAFAWPCAVAILAVLLNDLWTAHALLPTTLSGRRWLYFGASPGSWLSLALHFVGTWFYRIEKFFIGIDIPSDVNEKTRDTILYAPAIVAMMAAGVWRLIRERAWRILFLLLLTFVNFCVYAVSLPVTSHGGRYQAMIMVFVFPLFGLGALQIVDWAAALFKLGARASRIGYAAAAAAAALVAFFSLASWARITDASISHINATHVQMGKWIAANLGPDAKVATFDIGGIGYFRNAPIVDLGGLTDSAFLPYLFTRRTSAYLKEHDIRFVVVPMGDPVDATKFADAHFCDFAAKLALDETSGVNKRELKAFGGPYDSWNLGFQATGNACPRQVLYEILPQSAPPS